MDTDFLYFKNLPGFSGVKDRDGILSGLLADREAGLVAMKDLCFGPSDGDGPTDYEFGMMPPYLLSVIGFPGQDEGNPGRLFQSFLSVVPSPEIPEGLSGYLAENFGIPGSGFIGEKVEAVMAAGEKAMSDVVSHNLDAFVRNLDGETYAAMMGRLADEMYHSSLSDAVLSSYKSGDLRPELAVTFLSMKCSECPDGLYSKNVYGFTAFAVMKQFLNEVVKDGPYVLAPHAEKRTAIESVEFGSFIPGMDVRKYPEVGAPILKLKGGREIPFLIGKLSLRDMQHLVMDLAAERDRRNLSFLHVVPDNVDRLADILSSRGVADAMKVRVGTYGAGERFISVDGLRTAVPPEGVYVVFNPALRTGVYPKSVFEKLFEKTSSVSCIPRNVPRKEHSSGLVKGKGPGLN